MRKQKKRMIKSERRNIEGRKKEMKKERKKERMQDIFA